MTTKFAGPLPATNREAAPEPSLVLLYTGSAPRSRRARENLEKALDHTPVEELPVHEIDLLVEPRAAVAYRTFATPALLWTRGTHVLSVIYGDLSDERQLVEFLERGPW